MVSVSHPLDRDQNNDCIQAELMDAKAGDQEAFMTLLSRYDRQIMSVVYRFTGNLYDREDLYQEIFLHAFTSLKSFRGDASFQTWLYRLALNRCIKYMKKKPVYDEIEEAGVSQDMEQRARVLAVHKAASKLKGPQRICFHLFYVESWSLGDIAQLLDTREGTIKSHLDRARRKIKGDREVLQWQISTS